jgi:hypothetical protein
MTTRYPRYMSAIDVHEALAHVHAERGVMIAHLFAGLAALPMRMAAGLHRRRVSHKGA